MIYRQRNVREQQIGHFAAGDESHHHMTIRSDRFGEANRRTKFGCGKVVEGKRHETTLPRVKGFAIGGSVKVGFVAQEIE